jgi:hypothetical protein
LTYSDAQSLRIGPLKKKILITKIIQKQLQFQRVYNKYYLYIDDFKKKGKKTRKTG